jgi:hypothetical protein
MVIANKLENRRNDVIFCYNSLNRYPITTATGFKLINFLIKPIWI